MFTCVQQNLCRERFHKIYEKAPVIELFCIKTVCSRLTALLKKFHRMFLSVNFAKVFRRTFFTEDLRVNAFSLLNLNEIFPSL